MNNYKNIPYLLLLFAITLISAGKSSDALNICFKNIESPAGQVYVFVYNYENQYPRMPYKYFKIKKDKLHNGILEAQLPDLEYGKYAITVFDDENGNDDLDFSWGFPTEGYGFSNGQKLRFFMLPSFDDLLIHHSAAKKQFNIELEYP